MPRPPEDEGPAGPVPEAAEQKHHRLVQALPGRAPPAAPQGDVQVVPEPGGQRDVPPAPELGDGGGDVGVLEVLRRVKAQHLSQADGHVAVPGEVEVDLNGVGGGPQPGQAAVQPRSQGEGGIRQRGGQTRDQGLFGKAHGEPPQATGRLGGAEGRPLLQLGGEGGKAGDGSGGDLGEKGDVEQHVGEPAGGGVLVAADVDGVGYGFERKEGDAHRQEEVRLRQREPRQAVYDAGEEIQILEHAQHGELQGQHQGQQGPPGPHPGNQRPRPPAQHGGQEQKGQALPLSRGVEDQAGDEQEGVLPPPPRNEDIQQEQRRKQEEQKRGGVECQIKHPLHHKYERRAVSPAGGGTGNARQNRGRFTPPVPRCRGTRADGLVFYYISLQKVFRFFKRKVLIFVKICRKEGSRPAFSPRRRSISPVGAVFCAGNRSVS